MIKFNQYPPTEPGHVELTNEVFAIGISTREELKQLGEIAAGTVINAMESPTPASAFEIAYGLMADKTLTDTDFDNDSDNRVAFLQGIVVAIGSRFNPEGDNV